MGSRPPAGPGSPGITQRPVPPIPASTVSASWLESETYLESVILAGQEAATYNAAFDEAFLEMAAQDRVIRR